MDEVEAEAGALGDGEAMNTDVAAQPAAYLALTFPQNPDVLYTVQHEYACR